MTTPYATSEHQFHGVTCARMREIILDTAIHYRHDWMFCAICEAEGDEAAHIVHAPGCEYETLRGEL